jgi:hypothetical protein
MMLREMDSGCNSQKRVERRGTSGREPGQEIRGMDSGYSSQLGVSTHQGGGYVVLLQAEHVEQESPGLFAFQVLPRQQGGPDRHQEGRREHAEEWPEIHHSLPQITKIISGLADKSPE